MHLDDGLSGVGAVNHFRFNEEVGAIKLAARADPAAT